MMNKQLKSIMIGLLFLITGVLLALRAFEVIDFDIFFSGWWTLFLIIPAIFGLLSNESKTGNIIVLVIGLALLLTAQDVLSFELVYDLMIPIILVIIGISIVFREAFMNKLSKKIAAKKKLGDESKILACFSSQKPVIGEKKFEGANLDAVFGGIDLDLRKAKLEKETVITASAIFGGVTILVPKDVNVEVRGSAIFGEISNKVENLEKATKTIYVDGQALFGGVEIKWEHFIK